MRSFLERATLSPSERFPAMGRYPPTSLRISDEREHDDMWDSLTRLAVESSGVIALRMTKLMLGGKRAARREARLMVSEKIDVSVKATRTDPRRFC